MYNKLLQKNSLIRRIIAEFTPVEFVSLAFFLVLGIITLIYSASVDVASILSRFGIATATIMIVNWVAAYSKQKWVHILHTFYLLILIIIIFKTVEKLSFPIHGHDYDAVLILVDRSIFGFDPTIWLYHHIPVMPILIEFLQICYFSYYFLPVIITAELFVRRQKHLPGDHSAQHLEYLRFIMLYGLLASYLVYLIMPGIGPRFTLHEFLHYDQELPGLLLTDAIRWIINTGENITNTMTSVEAARTVTRDVFPSGHTELTILSMILAFRFRVRARWLIFVLGSGLIFSTVYLRYHYVIDIAGGAVLAMIVLYTADPLIQFFIRFKQRHASS